MALELWIRVELGCSCWPTSADPSAGELSAPDWLLSGDGSFAEHEVARSVDAVSRDEFAVAEVEAGEVTVAARIAA